MMEDNLILLVAQAKICGTISSFFYTLHSTFKIYLESTISHLSSSTTLVLVTMMSHFITLLASKLASLLLPRPSSGSQYSSQSDSVKNKSDYNTPLLQNLQWTLQFAMEVPKSVQSTLRSFLSHFSLTSSFIFLFPSYFAPAPIASFLKFENTRHIPALRSLHQAFLCLCGSAPVICMAHSRSFCKSLLSVIFSMRSALTTCVITRNIFSLCSWFLEQSS